MTGEEILKQIGNPYEERYLAIRQLPSWPNLNNPLHLALLLIDFDTELCMQGILGFLENSTGAYLDPTIDAFHMIGAEKTANTLSQIRETMARHVVSHERLRSDFQDVSHLEITSFSRLHPGLGAFADDVGRLAESLYLHDRSQESPFALLEKYLERHSTEVLAELGRMVR